MATESKWKVVPKKIVIFNLSMCLIIFYAVYYMASSICFGIFRLSHFDGLMPFNFKVKPAWSGEFLACLVSTDVTCFICGILFTSFVKHWIWDYATSTIIIHIIVTSAVMRAFPLVWQWWTVLGSGLALMVVTGQLLAALVYTTGTEKLEIT
uniref:putative transmembrane protein 244 isoform X1 n=1 Tax=Myxine glutinosa TaxID=7769 RepID=UPI00358EA061